MRFKKKKKQSRVSLWLTNINVENLTLENPKKIPMLIYGHEFSPHNKGPPARRLSWLPWQNVGSHWALVVAALPAGCPAEEPSGELNTRDVGKLLGEY